MSMIKKLYESGLNARQITDYLYGPVSESNYATGKQNWLRVNKEIQRINPNDSQVNLILSLN